MPVKKNPIECSLYDDPQDQISDLIEMVEELADLLDIAANFGGLNIVGKDKARALLNILNDEGVH